MYFTLKNLESKISKEIDSANRVRKILINSWSEDPMADYISHEINGLKIAMDIIQKESAKELVELDKWAVKEISRRNLSD